MIKKLKGSLLIAAVALITFIGFLGITAAYLFSNNAVSDANQANSTQALYLAQAGMERALRLVANPVAASRLACASVTGNANLTNVALDGGRFTVTGTVFTPSATTLSAAITASATIIPLTTTSGYASSGAIIVDSESIDYGALGSGSTQCGGASACLLGVVRGAGGTTAASHSAGATVTQGLCRLVATGNIPNSTSPTASRSIAQGVTFNTPVPLVWAVGNKVGVDETIVYWNGTSWVRYGPTANTDDNQILRSIFFSSATTGWIVGDRWGASTCGNSQRSLFLQFNGTDFNPFCSANMNQSMDNVDCVSSTYCKAVGDARTIGTWNGSSWSADTTSAIPNTMYNDIDCITSSNCFAVGQNSGGELIVSWNGSSWSRVGPSGTLADQNLNAIHCLSSTFCVAVGAARSLFVYNGSSWSNMTFAASVPNVEYNDVHCLATNNCWAVGANSGGFATFINWNGTTWSRNTGLISGVPNQIMNGITCTDASNCWAVGNSGAAAYWNGTQWTNSAGAPAVTLLHVSSFATGGGGSGTGTARVLLWREVNN